VIDRLYEFLGGGLIVLLLFGHYLGWSVLDSDTIPNLPKDVRDNPGSYRSVYRTHTYYGGGK